MSKVIDITGQKFGMLKVINRAENSKDGRAMWFCKCDCGNEKVTSGKSLRIRKVKFFVNPQNYL